MDGDEGGILRLEVDPAETGVEGLEEPAPKDDRDGMRTDCVMRVCLGGAAARAVVGGARASAVIFGEATGVDRVLLLALVIALCFGFLRGEFSVTKGRLALCGRFGGCETAEGVSSSSR